ncbi:MAG: tetratricopeptide repeat protein [Anaerolineae bacterium]|jgi:tetratricopeptide (TPR) repeat protein
MAPIPVNSIEFEYVYVANQRCACGGYFAAVRQELRRGPAGPVDVLTARCEGCGAERTFEFDVGSFFGQWEKYGRFRKTDQWFREAMAHWSAGRLAEAEEALRQVVDAKEGEPAFAWGHYHLGRVLLLEERVEEARAHLERAAVIQPLEPDIREALARALEAMGEPEAAQAQRRESAALRARFPDT